FTGLRRDLIVDLAARYRLPAMFSGADFVKRGGLMSYETVRIDQYRSAASYVDRILNGAKPNGLPVQKPIRFFLTINRTTTPGPRHRGALGRVAWRRRGDRMSAPAASWCDPAGGSPAQVGSSVRLVASVA